MFLHHRDNLARVRAGARRRDKRMKKNLAVCYPNVQMNHVHAQVKEERDSMLVRKERSRSSSFASVESGVPVQNNMDGSICLPDVTTNTRRSSLLHCISPTFPDLIPITISREVGKSWGILLAREGSMCIVMRVPDTNGSSTNATGKAIALQRGDLIVSIRNERDEIVNTPTSHSIAEVSPEWFSEAVGLFKRSNMMHLEVRRVSSTV